MSSNALLIFIKNPEKGKVKTRLAQSVGDDKALKIYLALLQHTKGIAQSIPADRLLFYSNYIKTQDQWPTEDFQKYLQYEGDLGERMLDAFRKALAKHQKAVIIGSDCASLTPAIVEDAFVKLDSTDIVIGPALDGGYYLLGMKALHPFLFNDMTWSVASVFDETVTRIKAHALTYDTLPTLSDIDYEEDWEKYGWEV